MLVLKNIHKFYNKGKKNELEALRGIDLTIRDGEFVAIVGASGAGKSTLLHVLGCIDSFEGGQYFIDDIEISGLGDKKLSQIRNERLGIVLQDFALIEEYTVLQNAMTALYFSRSSRRGRKQKAMEALQNVGIGELAQNDAGQISGGQKQRTAIARAIANGPNVLLADEPTGALDSNTSAEIMEVFAELNRQGKTVIIITHDPIVAQKCNRVIQISDGVICSDEAGRDAS